MDEPESGQLAKHSGISKGSDIVDVRPTVNVYHGHITCLICVTVRGQDFCGQQLTKPQHVPNVGARERHCVSAVRQT